jgi:TPP-dependent pyruvate/acetoin dehydrogenase alpha subunit
MDSDDAGAGKRVDTSILVEIYRRATLIHQTDSRIRSGISKGEFRLAYYPVRGQEVVSAAMMAALDPDDQLVTTYRGLHDQLAKGVPLPGLLAEFLGKATGPCKGKGGPMHITDPASGVMVTTGVVGSGLPIANGLALSSQMNGDKRVTVACFGDGASNIGAFHEALNLASVWNLPVIFLCQNNRYGEHTPYAQATSAKQVIDRAPGYGMAAVRVDGNDAEAMYLAAREAVERARGGGGPTLVEAMTYRMVAHVFGSDTSYVPATYGAEAEAADPLPRLKAALAQRQVAVEDLTGIEAEIADQLAEAVAFALSSPYPQADELRFDVLGEEIAA